ncbi:G patch domain-containing protein 1 [Dermatophagoides pteronyssinus]|uniref:G patch domain-containing protein 1 n=1 Tax=Dermatophagoides pteronyssinus TaxID=6956 RepID=A0ABQ8JK10_DERPT|nr:G patch domain-containing protein 1 [Dermatophagoides pteronyssinus]
MSYYDNDQNGDEGIVGTPFPALEADEIVSRKPDIDQTVRDERGRRRFHGAFTGGFSAGYWNTVGSAEGFTPKIFKSSRKDKFNKDDFVSKPEDYMDDEDFGSFGIAPKKIHTKDDFVENFTLSSLKDSHLTFDEVIRSVFQPSKESIGKRLFCKMKRTAKLEQKDLYEDDEPVDPKTKDNRLLIQSKTNRHGLGYKGMLNSEISDSTSDNKRKLDSGNAVLATMKSGRRLKIIGEAFGYGALEEDDAMDIYSHDDLSKYDFEIGPVAQNKKPPTKKPFSTNPNATELDGFTKFKENFNLFQTIKSKYALPELPKGWKPRKIAEISNLKRQSRWDAKNNQPIDSDSNDKQQKVLNANLRAVILGENVVHKSGVAKSEPNKELEFSKAIKPTNMIAANVPVSKTPLSGYFASKFTRSSSTTTDEEQLTAGLNTFENVSITSLQLDRKPETSSNKTVENLAPIRTVYEWHPHKLLCKRFGVQNPYPQFPDVIGIVCMRESDKSRNMITRTNSKQANQEKKSLFGNIFSELNSTSDIQPSTLLSNKTSQSNESEKCPPIVYEKDQRPVLEEITENESEQQSQLIEQEKSRPPIDLFKSIFASDEEEDDELENENPNESISKNQNDNLISKQSVGIFAGIDFDQLNQDFDPRLNSTSDDTKDQDLKSVDEADDDDDEECYGPALPPELSNPESIKLATPSTHTINDNKPLRHKKVKKSKKSKKSKTKKSSSKHHYHRKKKRQRTSSSSSDGSNNDDDNDNDWQESEIDRSVKDKLIDFIKKVKHR